MRPKEWAWGSPLRAAFSREWAGKSGWKANREGVASFVYHSLETNFEHASTRNEMSEAANILLVDDEPGMLRYIRTLLEVDEHKVQTASTGEEAVERVQKGLQPDLVLLDLLMPGIDGLETLEQLRHLKPGLKVVMLSCVNDTRKVVQAMRLGAIDYLTKPFQKAELDAVIGQCVGAAKGESYAGEVEELCDDVFFVAASPAMKKIRSQAALVANVDIPVLLLGESGTARKYSPA